MDLFILPGEKTKYWYVRVCVRIDLKGHFGKATELRQSAKTADKVEAMARAGVFVTAKAGQFRDKRTEIAAMGGARAAMRVVLDQNLIRNIASIRFANLRSFDGEYRDGHAGGERSSGLRT
jgi:hypothetical protein